MNCRAADGLLHGWLGLSKGLHASLGTSRATTSRVARVIAQPIGVTMPVRSLPLAFLVVLSHVDSYHCSTQQEEEEEEEVKEVREGV